MSCLNRRSFLEHTLAVAGAAWHHARPQGRLSRPKLNQPRARLPAAALGSRLSGFTAAALDHLDAYTFDDRVEIVALCDVDAATFGKAQRKLTERGRPAAQAVLGPSANYSKTNRSRPSRLPRRTTGTLWPPSGPCRRAKMFTLKNR